MIVKGWMDGWMDIPYIIRALTLSLHTWSKDHVHLWLQHFDERSWYDLLKVTLLPGNVLHVLCWSLAADSAEGFAC